MLSRDVLYFGREGSAASPLHFQAGPLSIVFDPEWATARYISIAGKEVIRGIYCAVRDQYWNTVKPQIKGLRVSSTPQSFEVRFSVECREGDVSFTWDGLVNGDESGLLFSMKGEALSTFRTNRIGFCVLHPMETCVGLPCRIEKSDGSSESTRFPYSIAPHQPFKDLQGITHEVFPGVFLETRFEGDVFETEDQRNWTDASYKTYCTPLERPYPVTRHAGDRIFQSIRVQLRGKRAGLPPVRAGGVLPAIVTVAPVGTPPLRLPTIGLCCSHPSFRPSAAATRRLRQLALTHLRVDLHLWKDGWEDRLRQATVECESLAVQLELAIHVSDEAEEELHRLLAQLRALKPATCRWLVFHKDEKSTSAKWIDVASKLLSGYSSRPPLGAGSNIYFTELNRGRPPAARLDLVSYPVNPQVHAFDDESVIETLAALPWTVFTAREFSGDVPLVVSPVTLKPRFNPTLGEVEERPDEIPDGADVRQVSLFGAVWTLGSIKHLAESGVASLTLFETAGPKGVLEREEGGPAGFPSIPGGVYPLYHVIADVTEFAGGMVVPTIVSTRPAVESLLLLKDRRRRLILANMTLCLQYVSISGCGFDTTVSVKKLDETTAEQALRDPEVYRSQPGVSMGVRDDALSLGLLPYSVVRIDSTEA